MPITFKSRHSPDVLMLESVALGLIRMMGHSGTVPSSLALADIPPALERLKRGVAANAETRSPPKEPDADEEREHGVSLSQRAQPLIHMLETALTEGDYVIWDR